MPGRPIAIEDVQSPQPHPEAKKESSAWGVRVKPREGSGEGVPYGVKATPEHMKGPKQETVHYPDPNHGGQHEISRHGRRVKKGDATIREPGTRLKYQLLGTGGTWEESWREGTVEGVEKLDPIDYAKFMRTGRVEYAPRLTIVDDEGRSHSVAEPQVSHVMKGPPMMGPPEELTHTFTPKGFEKEQEAWGDTIVRGGPRAAYGFAKFLTTDMESRIHKIQANVGEWMGYQGFADRHRSYAADAERRGKGIWLAELAGQQGPQFRAPSDGRYVAPPDETIPYKVGQLMGGVVEFVPAMIGGPVALGAIVFVHWSETFTESLAIARHQNRQEFGYDGVTNEDFYYAWGRANIHAVTELAFIKGTGALTKQAYKEAGIAYLSGDAAGFVGHLTKATAGTTGVAAGTGMFDLVATTMMDVSHGKMTVEDGMQAINDATPEVFAEALISGPALAAFGAAAMRIQTGQFRQAVGRVGPETYQKASYILETGLMPDGVTRAPEGMMTEARIAQAWSESAMRQTGMEPPKAPWVPSGIDPLTKADIAARPAGAAKVSFRGEGRPEPKSPGAGGREPAPRRPSRPAPEAGTTRVYRGNRPGEEGKNPSFTTDLEGIPKPFAKQYGGSVTYVDVPDVDLARYGGAPGGAPGAEFALPPEVAAKAKPLPGSLAAIEAEIAPIVEAKAVHAQEARRRRMAAKAVARGREAAMEHARQKPQRRAEGRERGRQIARERAAERKRAEWGPVSYPAFSEADIAKVEEIVTRKAPVEYQGKQGEAARRQILDFYRGAPTMSMTRGQLRRELSRARALLAADPKRTVAPDIRRALQTAVPPNNQTWPTLDRLRAIQAIETLLRPREMLTAHGLMADLEISPEAMAQMEQDTLEALAQTTGEPPVTSPLAPPQAGGSPSRRTTAGGTDITELMHYGDAWEFFEYAIEGESETDNERRIAAGWKLIPEIREDLERMYNHNQGPDELAADLKTLRDTAEAMPDSEAEALVAKTVKEAEDTLYNSFDEEVRGEVLQQIDQMVKDIAFAHNQPKGEGTKIRKSTGAVGAESDPNDPPWIEVQFTAKKRVQKEGGAQASLIEEALNRGWTAEVTGEGQVTVKGNFGVIEEQIQTKLKEYIAERDAKMIAEAEKAAQPDPEPPPPSDEQVASLDAGLPQWLPLEEAESIIKSSIAQVDVIDPQTGQVDSGAILAAADVLLPFIAGALEEIAEADYTMEQFRDLMIDQLQGANLPEVWFDKTTDPLESPARDLGDYLFNELDNYAGDAIGRVTAEADQPSVEDVTPPPAPLSMPEPTIVDMAQEHPHVDLKQAYKLLEPPARGSTDMVGAKVEVTRGPHKGRTGVIIGEGEGITVSGGSLPGGKKAKTKLGAPSWKIRLDDAEAEPPAMSELGDKPKPGLHVDELRALIRSGDEDALTKRLDEIETKFGTDVMDDFYGKAVSDEESVAQTKDAYKDMEAPGEPDPNEIQPWKVTSGLTPRLGLPDRDVEDVLKGLVHDLGLSDISDTSKRLLEELMDTARETLRDIEVHGPVSKTNVADVAEAMAREMFEPLNAQEPDKPSWSLEEGFWPPSMMEVEFQSARDELANIRVSMQEPSTVEQDYPDLHRALSNVSFKGASAEAPADIAYQDVFRRKTTGKLWYIWNDPHKGHKEWLYDAVAITDEGKGGDKTFGESELREKFEKITDPTLRKHIDKMLDDAFDDYKPPKSTPEVIKTAPDLLKPDKPAPPAVTGEPSKEMPPFYRGSGYNVIPPDFPTNQYRGRGYLVAQGKKDYQVKDWKKYQTMLELWNSMESHHPDLTNTPRFTMFFFHSVAALNDGKRFAIGGNKPQAAEDLWREELRRINEHLGQSPLSNLKMGDVVTHKNTGSKWTVDEIYPPDQYQGDEPMVHITSDRGGSKHVDPSALFQEFTVEKGPGWKAAAEAPVDPASEKWQGSLLGLVMEVRNGNVTEQQARRMVAPSERPELDRLLSKDDAAKARVQRERTKYHAGLAEKYGDEVADASYEIARTGTIDLEGVRTLMPAIDDLTVIDVINIADFLDVDEKINSHGLRIKKAKEAWAARDLTPSEEPSKTDITEAKAEIEANAQDAEGALDEPEGTVEDSGEGESGDAAADSWAAGLEEVKTPWDDTTLKLTPDAKGKAAALIKRAKKDPRLKHQWMEKGHLVTGPRPDAPLKTPAGFGAPGKTLPGAKATPWGVLVEAASTDVGRFAINGVYVSEHGDLVTTDGRRLHVLHGDKHKMRSIVVQGKTLKAGKIYEVGKKGVPGAEMEGNFPPYKEVIPEDDKKQLVIEIKDLGQLHHRIVRAMTVLKQDPSDKGWPAVSLFRNPDGSIGVGARHPEVGEAHINLHPDAEFFGGYNPEFLIAALRLLKVSGSSTGTIRVTPGGVDKSAPKYGNRVMVIRSEKATAAIMPVNYVNAPETRPGITEPIIESGQPGKKLSRYTAGEEHGTMGAAPDPSMEIDPDTGLLRRKLRSAADLVGKVTGPRPTMPPEEQQFLDKEVERRFQESSKGIPRMALWEHIVRWRKSIKEQFMRGGIPKLSRNIWGEVRDALNQISQAPSFATYETERLLANTFGQMKMSHGDYELFRRVVFLENFEESVQKWKEQDEEGLLPWGLTEESLPIELARQRALLAENPKAQAALDFFRKWWPDMVDDYFHWHKVLGINLKGFDRQKYVRHQVIEIFIEQMSQKRQGSGQSTGTRMPNKKSWHRRRRGSDKDINAHFFQVMWEVATQMIAETRRAQGWVRIDKEANILGKLKAEVKDENWLRAVGGPANAARIVELTEEIDNLRAYLEEHKKELDSDEKKHIKLKLKDWAEERRELDPTMDAKRKMRIGFDKLAKMEIYVEDGDFQAINDLAKSDNEDIRFAARTILKGFNEKRQAIIDAAEAKGPWGDVHADIDGFLHWQQIVPETHGEWAIQPGRALHPVQGVPERVAYALLQELAEEVAITKEDLKEHLALGGPHRTMVLPLEVIEQLKFMEQQAEAESHQRDWVKLSAWGMKKWKRHMLQFPTRFLGYNFRNATEAEKATALPTKELFNDFARNVPKATAAMFKVFFDTANAPKQALEWMAAGGGQSLTLVNEIGDVPKIRRFAKLAEAAEQNIARKGIKAVGDFIFGGGYWQGAARITNFRESILRYAMYLTSLSDIARHGEPTFFVNSNYKEVLGIRDPVRQALRISLDAFGDYSDVSIAGQKIRRHLMPFWAFQELTLRAYVNAVRNVAYEESMASKHGQEYARRKGWKNIAKSPYAARVAWRLLIMAAGAKAILYAWNQLLFEDENEELPLEVRRRGAHFILPWPITRRADGSVNYFTRLGTSTEFSEWFGAEYAVGDLIDLAIGRRSINQVLGDYDNWLVLNPFASGFQGGPVKSPINKIASGSTPLIKTPLEAFALNAQMFPDVFNMRPIRNKARYWMQQLAIEDLDTAFGMAPKRGSVAADIALHTFSTSHPGEASYWRSQELKRRYMHKIGRGMGYGAMTPRSNAMYNIKQGMRAKDQAYIDRWMNEWVYLSVAQGMDAKKMARSWEASMRTLSPLYGLNEEQKGAFLAQLDPNDFDEIERAYSYYATYLRPPAR